MTILRPPSFTTGAGITLGMGSANGRRRYFATSFLISLAYTQNDPCGETKNTVTHNVLLIVSSGNDVKVQDRNVVNLMHHHALGCGVRNLMFNEKDNIVTVSLLSFWPKWR